MRYRVVLLVALAAVLNAPSAVASSAGRGGGGPACGDVVVADVVLKADLVGCSTGLIVGADNITIDLNGRSIRGASTLEGSGIDATGRSGIHIKDGRISGFATGVQFLDSALSSVERLTIRDVGVGISVLSAGVGQSNRIERNSISDSVSGIVAFAPLTLVRENRLEDLTGDGIVCRASGRIEGNRVVRAANAIVLLFCSADVVENDVLRNTGIGIWRVRSEGDVVRNRANSNGSGIVSDDSHGVFSRNVTNDNAGNGLTISDESDTHGPFHTVEDHVAKSNGGLGITTNLLGVIQLGKNRAHGNGDPRECVNIVCR